MRRTDVVCDASALVTFLTARDERAASVATLLDSAVVNMPHLALFEITNTIRLIERRSEITSEAAVAALGGLFSLDVEYWSNFELLTRAWELRHNLTAYDASYVALAEQLDAPLVTLDTRLANAPGIQCAVVVP